MAHKLLLVLLFSLVLPWPVQAVAASTLQSVRMTGGDQHRIVHFRFDDVPEYRYFSLDDPARAVIDFKSTEEADDLADQSDDSLDQWRLSSQEKRLRAVMDLEDGADVGSIKVEGNEIVARVRGMRADDDSVADEPEGHPDEPEALYRAAARNGPLVVAIDPGHGGSDSGTHGINDLKEKEVSLTIGRMLYQKLKATRNIHPVMTRNSDTYVSLKDRVTTAQKKQADLFISIHENSFHKEPSVKGASCYVLSQNGASDAKADQLANFENSSDHNVAGVEFSSDDKTLNAVLTDLHQNTAIESAENLAQEVIDEFGKIGPLYSRKPPRANFAVLRNPMTPSILCETAFMSNPEQAEQLKTRRYRDQLAEAMFQGIMNYYRNNPPEQARSTAK